MCLMRKLFCVAEKNRWCIFYPRACSFFKFRAIRVRSKCKSPAANETLFSEFNSNLNIIKAENLEAINSKRLNLFSPNLGEQTT